MRVNINTLRTPDDAFHDLKDYPFMPNYLEVDGFQMHYLDEGNDSDKVIFLLHGQPSWSYLYRHMIPVFVNTGFRVIAPDLIGFGKSDKPFDSNFHTYENHVKWLGLFVDKLGINGAAAFMQDWGGMIGLRVLARKPEWLERLVVANTALAQVNSIEKFMVPKVLKLLVTLAGKPELETFQNKINYGNWAGYFKHSEQLEVGEIIQTLTTRTLDDDEVRAYDAPFPSAAYYAGPRKMPQIVASDLANVNKDWEKLKSWSHPVLTLFSNQDPFLAERDYDQKFQQDFPGADKQPHEIINNASHFLQEDQSEVLANKTITWLNKTNF